MRKKLLCLLLCVVMMAALFVGCTPSGSGNGGSMKVGYGRVDVTPKEAVPLAGFGYTRITNEALNKLYVTCIAFTDENDNTVLIYHMDILNTWDILYNLIPTISQETGVPKDNIILAATHNHSAPSMSDQEVGYMSVYRVLFKRALIDSAKQALEDRAAAEMYITSCKPENMTFVRHYVRDDGYINGHGGSAEDADRYVGHPVEADNEMQLIKFTRKGKKDVLLMNWQGHPRGHSEGENRENMYYILSDVDVIRQRLEADMDCQFAYFLGASGNMNNSSQIPSEQRTSNYVEHGNVLADEAIAAAKNFTKVQTGAVKVITDFSLQSRKDGKTSEIPMTVFSIGDVAFLSAGYEMFCESGIELKEASPFKMTFIVTCSNGDFKYMPTLATYKYDAYETGTATRHVKGTAEKLVTKYKAMLTQLAAAE